MGRRTDARRVASTGDQLRRISPSPLFFLLFPLSQSYATKLVPVLGGKRRPMVRRRRSPFGMPFGEASTTLLGTREPERREHLHSPREMRARVSLSLSLSRVIAHTVKYIGELYAVSTHGEIVAVPRPRFFVSSFGGYKVPAKIL